MFGRKRTAAAVALWVCCPCSPTAAHARPAESLTLDEARSYMVQLINQDRAAKNLLPVILDPVATLAAQRHADDMATHRYMSHYSLEGKSPNQRYTEAGGTNYSRENVYLSTTRYTDSPAVDPNTPSTLQTSARFTRGEIEEMESSYVNEVPPSDGHRRNVMAPEHTHVGIGLARSASPAGRALANTQEFVDRYVDTEPIPASCAPGQEIRVAGMTAAGVKFRSISVGRAPLPAPLTRERATAIHSYSVPAAETTYWPAPYRSPRQVRLSSDGSFSVTLRPGDNREPGLYYIGVWVTDHGRDLLASLRTIAVR